MIIYSDIDRNADSWQQLLNEKHTAERDLETLAAQVVSDHDDNHGGNLRWCSSQACRTIAARLGS